MKKLTSLITLGALLYLLPASGQAPDNFVSDINQAWIGKNYPAIASRLEQELLAKPNDIAALYASYNFHLMIQPDLAKLTSAASKIKVIADSANKTLITEVSTQIQTNIGTITQEGVRPAPQALLSRLHRSSPQEFPMMNIGVKMRTALQP
jgi:hypothetical protein